MIDQYRARVTGDVGDAVSLGQQPLAYAELGMDQGKALSPAAVQGSQYLSGAALASSKGMMGRYMGYGNALRSLGGSIQAQQQRNDSIYRASGIDNQRSAILAPGGVHF